MVAAAIRAGLDAITLLGKARVGDKTMLDALAPVVDTLEQHAAAGNPLPEAWTAAADAAQQAAEATARLKPRVGRARPLAERSLGTPDAGALSLALCARTAGDVLRQPDPTQPQ
jgi:dihydroxyacetone kinase